MGMEQMDTAASKIRRALAVVSLLEVAAEQVTREEIMEAVGVLKDHLQEAGAAIEEAYSARQKPGPAPALVQPQPRAPVTSLVTTQRPFQTPG